MRRTPVSVVLAFALVVLVSGCKLQLGGKKSDAGAQSSGVANQSGGSTAGSLGDTHEVVKIKLTDAIQNLLHRAPTQEELDAYKQLASDPDKAAAVAAQLVRDPARRTTVLQGHCQEILGRACTADEVSLYMDMTDQPGKPGEREEVVGLLVSSDAKARATSLNLTYPAFVYQELMKREGTDMELRTFTVALHDHSAQSVVLALTLTPESAGLVVDDMIEQYGKGIITDDERTQYINELTSGARYETVLAKIVTLVLTH